MYAAVEHGPLLCSDSNILCLSWKGRVPKSEKEKPVCRRRYYEEGWLATGNGRGVVGVTFTSSHCRRDRNTPQRINFNLRGHNSESCKSPSRTFKAWIIWWFLNWLGKQTYQVPFEECVYMCKTFSHHINFFIRRRSEHQEFCNWWKLKINLSIRWNNFLLLGSGVHGEQPITNGRFSLWCSWAKATSQKKKIAQIKPKENLSSVKKEQT